MGSLTGAVTQYASEDRKSYQEEQKFEASLILEALKSNDPKQRLESLNFLINTGLISDRDERLGAILREQDLSKPPAVKRP